MASLQSVVSTAKRKAGGSGQLAWPTAPEIGEANVSCLITPVKGTGNSIKFPAPKEIRSTFGLDFAMTDLALYRWLKDVAPKGWNPSDWTNLGAWADAAKIATLKAIPGESVAAGILRSQGKAVNPHSGLVFNSVKPRVFNYTFECVARNAGDMKACTDIFKDLRSGCLPKAESADDGIFWSYPDKYTMEFSPDTAMILPKTLECHITDLDFNFTGAIGSFITDIADQPVMAMLTITLAEIELVSRQEVDDKKAR